MNQEKAIQPLDKSQMMELITFSVSEAQILKMREEYLQLSTNGVEDKEAYQACDRTRKDLKKLRNSIERRRKELKDVSLAFGRAVDERANGLKDGLSEIETHLKIETDKVDSELARIAAEEKKKAEEKLNKRLNLLNKYQASFSVEAIKIMTDEEFLAFAQRAKSEYLQREAEKKALQEERERLEQEKRELEAQKKALEAQREKEQAERDTLRVSIVEGVLPTKKNEQHSAFSEFKEELDVEKTQSKHPHEITLPDSISNEDTLSSTDVEELVFNINEEIDVPDEILRIQVDTQREEIIFSQGIVNQYKVLAVVDARHFLTLVQERLRLQISLM